MIMIKGKAKINQVKLVRFEIMFQSMTTPMLDLCIGLFIVYIIYM